MLSVLVFHAFPSLLQGGFVGVDIFFVISGFLITGIIAREIDSGQFSIAKFYERRARRILPALFVMIAFVLLGASWLYLPGDFEGHPMRKDFPLLSRIVKPWPGIVDVEPLPGGGDDEGAAE